MDSLYDWWLGLSEMYTTLDFVLGSLTGALMSAQLYFAIRAMWEPPD